MLRAAQSSEPILFPKLRIYFAEFPYLRYSTWPEAMHLGDLMRLLVRPGVGDCGRRFSWAFAYTPDTSYVMVLFQLRSLISG